MRPPLICANWKMYKTFAEAESFVLAAGALAGAGVEVALFPAAPFLEMAARRLAGTGVRVGAQACHHEKEGAFTGAVSMGMARSCGAELVLVGHSERRRVFGEQDAVLRLQLRAALAAGLSPMLCVGETLEEREGGQTEAVLTRQLTAALEGLTAAEAARLEVAYEPVWAIGTGRTATVEIAAAAHAFVKRELVRLLGEAVGGSLRVLYGGSVKPDNAAALTAAPHVDGLLVGGASLALESFRGIVAGAREGRARRTAS